MAQYLLNRIGSCRLFPQQQNAFVSALRGGQSRTFVNRAATRPVPKPEGEPLSSSPHLLLTVKTFIEASGLTTEKFLTLIGRGAVDKVKVTDWNEFWKLDGHALKDAGLPVRDRRYILWCMEKFRQGVEPSQFAHPPKPKKKIRGCVFFHCHAVDL